MLLLSSFQTLGLISSLTFSCSLLPLIGQSTFSNLLLGIIFLIPTQVTLLFSTCQAPVLLVAFKPVPLLLS